MAYGKTFEEVSKIHRPLHIVKNYGKYCFCINEEPFSLERYEIKMGKSVPMQVHFERDICIYLISGEIVLRNIINNGEKSNIVLNEGEVVELKRKTPYGINARRDSVVYVLSNKYTEGDFLVLEKENESQMISPAITKDGNVKAGKTFNVLDKYCGKIESIFSGEFAGKKLIVRAGSSGSLEYHVHKTEAYYIHSGSVKIGLRIGRAENKSVVLKEGDVFIIKPGTMHCRIGTNEDCTFIEISTKDDDGDSNLVEDGTKYKHIEQ